MLGELLNLFQLCPRHRPIGWVKSDIGVVSFTSRFFSVVALALRTPSPLSHRIPGRAVLIRIQSYDK